ncbi:CusA/CzcA family heavy metal efflux RND transporter [Gemmatimonas aurantiaca]|uniref:efflux RND transporter permease subunit n=1 Tax=Gemmatimonas aurantiaca TaxID=173480 RepID=UPI00301C6A49
MLDAIARFSLRQRLLVLVLSVVLVIAGVASWRALKLEAYPDVSDTEVAIITQYDGRAAEEVEQQITIPVERAVNSVPRVLNRRSRTIFGLSIVKLTFQEGTDDFFARQQVLEKLRDVDLPAGAQPQLAPLSTPVGEIVRYVVEGDARFNSMQLRELQDWVVIPRLLQAPGVTDITNFGGLVRQYNVVIDPERLQKFGLTIQQLAESIRENNGSTGGNVIRSGASQLAVRVVGRIIGREDLERTVVSTQRGVPLFLRDIASVEMGPLPPTGVLGFTDLIRNEDVDDGVEGIVLMRRGENPSEVLEAVKSRIDELNAGALPDGARVRVLYDRSELVDATLRTVSHTLAEGLLIVTLMLLLFLGDLRLAAAVAVTIPLSLCGAFVLMKATGIPANLLSLGAIDFGIIVDASVVMVEAIARTLSHASDEERRLGNRRAIFAAGSEVRRQIVFAVLIIVLAFLPLFTLQRVEGKLFRPMAFTLSFAIGTSLVLALTIVPVACSLLLGRNFRERHNPVLHWLSERYRRTVAWVLRRPGPVLAGAAVLIVSSLAGARLIGTEFLPQLDEGGFNIRCILPSGIALDEARQYPTQIRAALARFPEVRVAISSLGRNDDGTDPYGPSRIETLVQLRPYDSWTTGRTKSDLQRAMQQALETQMPGASFSFSQPILDNVSEAVTGSAADLAVLVNGNHPDTLRRVALAVLDEVRRVPGASASGLEQEGPQTQLLVDVDREALARYGIDISDVNTVIDLAVAGSPVSEVYEGDRRFAITLRYTREARSSIPAIENLQILTTSGARIPLSQVARVKLVEGQTLIARENGVRQIGVRTNIVGRDQGSFVAEAQDRVAKAVSLPDGYDIRWGGQFENLTRARERLLLIVPITILLIFVVLFVLFDNSMIDAGVVLMNVPFAMVGGVAALLLRNINFSVSAGVGFISLFGVAVMSGVLLVSYINMLRQERLLRLHQAVLEGAVTQFRPILMMMSVALIGLIPAARAEGIGSDIQRPLASVIVGGLLSALLLTLLVMPALYFVVERFRVARQYRRRHARRAREGEDDQF